MAGMVTRLLPMMASAQSRAEPIARLTSSFFHSALGLQRFLAG